MSGVPPLLILFRQKTSVDCPEHAESHQREKAEIRADKWAPTCEITHVRHTTSPHQTISGEEGNYAELLMSSFFSFHSSAMLDRNAAGYWYLWVWVHFIST